MQSDGWENYWESTGKSTGALIIVRGVPGTGKTTWARKMNATLQLEADMYFTRNGTYEFDRDKLRWAHEWCLTTAQIMLSACHTVHVCNTFTTFSEMKDYIKYAVKRGDFIKVVTLTQEYGSVHNVPEETMIKMRDCFESHESIVKKINNEYQLARA